MPADNDVYERLGGSWWDEASPLNLLHGSVTPGRLAYFRGVLTRQFGAGPGGLRVLDIGCGGGFLAEELAALGCQVTGVDPAPATIAAARAHAAGRGLSIDYRVGAGEELPAGDASFAVACCCDVLEHVTDPGRVVGEAARVLRPGGLFLFDTLNRTWRSKLLAIKVTQQWPLTRLTDVAIHDWDQFITPAELAGLLERHGLAASEVTGLGARANPLTVLRGLAAARLGRITYGEFSRRLDVGQVASTAVSYMGFAVRAGAALPALWPPAIQFPQDRGRASTATTARTATAVDAGRAYGAYGTRSSWLEPRYPFTAAALPDPADAPGAGGGQQHGGGEERAELAPLQRPVAAGRLVGHQLVVGSRDAGDAVLRRGVPAL